MDVLITLEYIRLNPKDGELYMIKLKSKEISMEDCRDSDVQIDLINCVKGRKTNRTIE